MSGSRWWVRLRRRWCQHSLMLDVVQPIRAFSRPAWDVEVVCLSCGERWHLWAEADNKGVWHRYVSNEKPGDRLPARELGEGS